MGEASPEYRDAITRADPNLANGLNQTARLYEATENSRSLMIPAGKGGGNPASWTQSILGAGGLEAGLGYLGENLHSLGDHLGLWTIGTGVGAGALTAAKPLVMNGLANASQNLPRQLRRLAPTTDGMVTQGDKAVGSAIGMFPDTWAPPQFAEKPDGMPTSDWLSTADRPSALHFINQRLGNDVGRQLSNTDPAGYKAALFNLYS